MNIVLDTNVFISGIFWEGPPHNIITLAEERVIEIATTTDILKELYGVLQREKFDHLFHQAETTRDEIFKHISSLVTIHTPREETLAIPDDPSDNAFIDCALAALASCIVSGDQHLIKLKTFQNIPILTPKQFLKRMR